MLKRFALVKDLRDPLDQLLLQMRKPRPSKYKSFGQGYVCVSHSVISDSARQATLSMEFSRQEYWDGLSFLPPEDLPDPRDQTWVSCSAGRFFTVRATREVQSSP